MTDTVNIVSEINYIEIRFEDLFFIVFFFELFGYANFSEFSAESFFV